MSIKSLIFTIALTVTSLAVNAQSLSNDELPMLTATESSASDDNVDAASGAEITNNSITHKQRTPVDSDADAVIITAKDLTREYGKANPTLVYEVSGGTLDGIPELECSAEPNSPVGTYAITVKQGSVKNDNVKFVSGTLTVTKAPLYIYAGNYGRKQGEKNPTFKASYFGFRNRETADVLTSKPLLSTTATTVDCAPGEYPVTLYGAAAENYDIIYMPGTLVVGDADAIFYRAKDVSREYGDANPKLGYEVSCVTFYGFPKVKCPAVANSPVGVYTITVEEGTVIDKKAIYIPGMLTITPAPLTISALSHYKLAGDPMPTFKARYTGFKNNETEEVLEKKPEFTTTATESSARQVCPYG